MKLELFYFGDCPSSARALENVREALRLEGLPEEVALVRVESEADAQTKRFVGSPTIRIDGLDMEGAAAEEKGYGYACRVYAANGKSAGWPSVEKIREALAERKQA